MADYRVSWPRVIAIAGSIAAVAVAGTIWWTKQVEADARGALASNILAKMLGAGSSAGKGIVQFTDADGDLVADSPTDAALCTSPNRLVFSYIAQGEDASVDEIPDDHRRVWNELLVELSSRTGKSAEYRQFAKTDEQLSALERGEIHVLGLNTGAVEIAVERYGFVPVCTLGRDDGSFGYTMKIIVPAGAKLSDVAGLRGRRVTFTRPNSNSGFKAALVHLMDVHDLLPERDYQWSFSLDHDKSIQLTAAGETDAAAVASDLLAKMIDEGTVKADSIRTIYESERFPPATIGFAYNLAPELRDSIRSALLAFDWKDTELERKFGPMGATRFVPVSYKDDWANIRRIERSLDQARFVR